jgi:hypothetical protein
VFAAFTEPYAICRQRRVRAADVAQVGKLIARWSW